MGLHTIIIRKLYFLFILRLKYYLQYGVVLIGNGGGRKMELKKYVIFLVFKRKIKLENKLQSRIILGIKFYNCSEIITVKIVVIIFFM